MSNSYWLIEHYDLQFGVPQYLRVVLNSGFCSAKIIWNADPSVALQFAREVDAKHFALLHPDHATLAKITEHVNLGMPR